ncbi:protein of unknown function [Pseudodesulfovibrio profundus]|uniref:Uncharacterized protein n=1 Tax=Pseudodesulfovibrio profundus TaxID=57320 RepID=A0A2C8FA39_9BACT|nr:hypothetical protein [Pseudodesulfovibrio profundus]SOB59648.1 protein of unknown function [Pseudodesulfovibrio profundus]
MEWIAAAIVLVFLLWRWPKKTLIGGGVLVSLAAIGVGYLFAQNWYKDYQQETLIRGVNITVLKDLPPKTESRDKSLWDILDEEYVNRHIWRVTFNNTTNETITKIVWEPVVKKKGHSNKLNSGGYDRYTSDRIIPPGKSATSVWLTPKLTPWGARTPIEQLVLNVNITRVETQP